MTKSSWKLQEWFLLVVGFSFFFFPFPSLPVVCHPERDAGVRPSHAEHWLLLPAAGMLSSGCASGARYWPGAAGPRRSPPLPLRSPPLPPGRPGPRRPQRVHARRAGRAPPCTGTFPGSTAAAGAPRARTAAGTGPPSPGMPSAPAAGTSIRPASSTALRRCAPGEPRGPARAGARWSVCGTRCGRAPPNPPSPRAARGSGGQSAPVPTAGPPRCRWADSSLSERLY